ncbi:TPA: surface lipoprotein assembly modifier [Haemophilus influenzae]
MLFIQIMKNIIVFLSLCLISSNIYSETRAINYNSSDIKQNPAIIEMLLLDAIDEDNINGIESLLIDYQRLHNARLDLIAIAKFKIGQYQFNNYQNNKSLKNFQLAKLIFNFPPLHFYIIEQYLSVLKARESWQFSLGGNYLQTKNVNNTSNERHIENTGFVKNKDMLPQSAHGFAYYFDAQKNWNIAGSHYLHFANNLYGKNYWDNHNYDEITNRIYLGYQYQNAKYKLVLKPFYERQWLGGHRYNWANGARAEYSLNLSKNWQISTALELSQLRYFTQADRNGTIKLASVTFIWQPSDKGYYYLGSDLIRETTRIKQYSNDMKALRLGWRQNWGYAIASQINGSIALKQYKDFASLGGILPLNKIRRDKIYSLNLTLWKQDWQYLGFTPKVQFRWKKQESNLPSMFSYSEKYVQMLVEKDF